MDRIETDEGFDLADLLHELAMLELKALGETKHGVERFSIRDIHGTCDQRATEPPTKRMEGGMTLLPRSHFPPTSREKSPLD